MTKARKLGVPTPVLYSVDPMMQTLTLEFVEGPMVKDILLEMGANGIAEERLNDIATQIGESIAKLHDGGLIHGDLTTSNMLICKDTNQLVSFYAGNSWVWIGEDNHSYVMVNPQGQVSDIFYGACPIYVF